MEPTKPRLHSVCSMLQNTSDRLLRLECRALTVLLGWLLLLILLNVVTRGISLPLYWVDEAAVYSVVWLTFVGASAMTRLRMDFSVTMLSDKLTTKSAKLAKCISTGFVFLFGLAMVAMCWLWMDPVGIAKAGFDARVFSGETFNFLYTERTQTLNWPTWLLQLILPIFSLTFSVHALANLLEDLGWVERREHTEFQMASAEAVN